MRIELGETDIDLGDDLKMDVIEEGKSHLINELDSVEKYSEIKEQGFRSIIITPLTKVRKGSGQKSIGLIAVLTRERRDFSNQELSLMAAFSRYASLIIQNAQLYVKTQELAIRDGLTNLFNHRHFRTKLQEVLQTSDKEETEFSLIITDIDNFKQYNDTHGHPKGDVILREISRVLLDNTRGADLVARYGGEEFVIILPSTSKMGAKQLCSIIREKLKEHPFPHGDTQPQGRVTMTFGVASYPKEAKDAEELIELADVRMYKGKYKGKDTIVTE
jgi:diguanylate cyclase (GGDEF)-like protein